MLKRYFFTYFFWIVMVSACIASEEMDLLCCPISHDVMRDPVVASDGHSYEREEIIQHINQRKKEGRKPDSPLTRELIGDIQDLRPNRTLKSVIELYNKGLIDLENYVEKIGESLRILFSNLNPAAAELLSQIALGQFQNKEEVHQRIIELEKNPKNYPDILTKGASVRTSGVESINSLVKAFSGLVTTQENLSSRSYSHAEAKSIPSENLLILVSAMEQMVLSENEEGLRTSLLQEKITQEVIEAVKESKEVETEIFVELTAPSPLTVQNLVKIHKEMLDFFIAKGIGKSNFSFPVPSVTQIDLKEETKKEIYKFVNEKTEKISSHDFFSIDRFTGLDLSLQNLELMENWKLWYFGKFIVAALGDLNSQKELDLVLQSKKEFCENIVFMITDNKMGQEAEEFYKEQLKIVNQL